MVWYIYFWKRFLILCLSCFYVLSFNVLFPFFHFVLTYSLSFGVLLPCFHFKSLWDWEINLTFWSKWLHVVCFHCMYFAAYVMDDQRDFHDPRVSHMLCIYVLHTRNMIPSKRSWLEGIQRLSECTFCSRLRKIYAVG